MKHLDELEQLYAGGFWSDAEMGEHLGVDRATIYKARRRMMEAGFVFIAERRGHYRLDPSRYMTADRTAALEALARRLGHADADGLILWLADMAIVAPDPLARLLELAELFAPPDAHEK